MTFENGSHISAPYTKTDEGLRYEVGSRADRFIVWLIVSVCIGTLIWAILGTSSALVWLVLCILRLPNLLPGLSGALYFTREGLQIEARDKSVVSIRWEEVEMICTGTSGLCAKTVFKNREGQRLGAVLDLSGPKSSEWQAIAAAYLPDHMVWRIPGRINRKVTRKSAVARSALGLVVGVLLLFWAWPSPETFLGDIRGRMLSVGLLLGSLVAFGYGLLYLFEFLGHKRAAAMGEWIDWKPFEKGSALVDFIRLVVGIRPAEQRQYAYKARAKTYDRVRDARNTWLLVGGLAAFLFTLLGGIFIAGGESKSAVPHWQEAAFLTFLVVATLTALSILSLLYLRQMGDLEVGLRDLIEFSEQGMVIYGQEVTACSWPKNSAHKGDFRTGLNYSLMRIDLAGSVRWYDLTAMEVLDQPET